MNTPTLTDIHEDMSSFIYTVCIYIFTSVQLYSQFLQQLQFTLNLSRSVGIVAKPIDKNLKHTKGVS